MSTNAEIAVLNENGSVEAIYLHWDGYNHNGAGDMLREHYTELDKVKELIKLGDLSTLGPEIGEKHDFDSRDASVCTAYGRDRGEDGAAADHYNDFAAFKREGCAQQYVYLFADGAWKMY